MKLKKIIETNNSAISENLNCEWLQFNNDKKDKLSISDLGYIFTYSVFKKIKLQKKRKQLKKEIEKTIFKSFFITFLFKKIIFLFFIYSLILVSLIFSIIYLCKMYMNYSDYNMLWFYIIPWCFLILSIVLLFLKLYYTGLVKYKSFRKHLSFIYSLSQSFILLIQVLSLVKNIELSFIICFVFWVIFSYLILMFMIYNIKVKNQKINHFIFSITFLEYERKIKSIKFDRYLIKRYIVLCEFKNIFFYHFPLNDKRKFKESEGTQRKKFFVDINNEMSVLEKKYKDWLKKLSH